MKRHTLISAALLTVMLGAVTAPAAGASPRNAALRHAARHARTVSFYATVVRASSSGLVVRTSSGRILHFAAAQIKRTRGPVAKRLHRHARRHDRGRLHRLGAASDFSLASSGPVVLNIVGLQPGVTVLITETVAPDGTITITINLPVMNSGQQNASGVVGDVEDNAFDITTADGTDLRLNMSADQLSSLNLQSCDLVNVTYHQDAGILIADSAEVTGASTSGDCAPTFDATGAITQVSDSSISLSTESGPMTFNVSSSDLTSGFQQGDVVDVTYTQNGDGSFDATDVQYVEQDSTGTVSSVSSSTLVITDSSTGQPDTFIADPANGLQLCTYAFDGVHTADQVDVTYHQTAAGLIADSVDVTPAGS